MFHMAQWPYKWPRNNWLKVTELFATFITIFGFLLLSVSGTSGVYNSDSLGIFLIVCNMFPVISIFLVIMQRTMRVFGTRIIASWKNRKKAPTQKQQLIDRKRARGEPPNYKPRGVLERCIELRDIDQIKGAKSWNMVALMSAIKAKWLWTLVNRRRKAHGRPPIVHLTMAQQRKTWATLTQSPSQAMIWPSPMNLL